MRKVAFVATCAAAIVTVASSSLFAAAITSGNLVIYRVGDKTAALGQTATAVFLDEYTPTGTLVQSIPLNTTGSSAVTAVGNATTEGVLGLSQDGKKLVFTGYRKDAGGSKPDSDTPAATNRVIGTIGLDGVVDVSTTLTDATGTIRSATTVNGTNYYIGTSAGVRYLATPATTSTVIDTRNSRQVNLFKNELIVSNGSSAITAKIQSYGTLPTTTTPAVPMISLAGADAVHGFAVLDLNPAVAGADTIYALSTVQNQLQKWVFNGTTWTQAGSLGASSAANLVALVNGTDVNLFLTSGASLMSIQDPNALTSTLSGSLTTLASALANSAFRGINVIPEPASLALLSLGALLIGRRKRVQG